MSAIAQVEPMTTARAMRGPFDYRLPPELRGGVVEVGSMLVVPFGRREVLGVVVGMAERSEVADEKLLAPLRARELGVPGDLVSLAEWIAAEYCSTISRALGLVLSAWSCWALGGLNQYAGVGDIFWPRIVQGFGMGLTFVPVMTVMLAPLPKNELASATGVSMLIRTLGASVGIAVLTTLLASEPTIAWMALAGGVRHAYGASIAQINGLIVQSATVIAYSYLFRICAFVFLAALPFVAFMRPARAAGTPAVEATEM